MPKEPSEWRVQVSAPCTMLVRVVAANEADAIQAVRQLDWEPESDWEADYEKVRIPKGSKPELLLDGK